MIGPFCYRDIHSDEEYIKHLKKKNMIFYFMMVCGIIAFLCIFIGGNRLTDYAQGFLAGAGTGLIVGSVVLIFKNHQILKDKHKLKIERIKITDERNRLISDRASRFALISILIEIYLVSIISLFFNSMTYRICIILLATFILLYMIAYRFYAKKL